MLESGILEVYPRQVTTLHWHKAEEEGVENAKIVPSRVGKATLLSVAVSRFVPERVLESFPVSI